MLTSRVQRQLKDIEQKNLIRSPLLLKDYDGRFVVYDGKRVLHFANNDYLGLSISDDVKASAIAAIDRHGVGSGASVQVSGFHAPHHDLEKAFADHLGRDRALVFNSGYHANLGIFSSLVGRNDVVISDRDSHASILDGIQLARANHYRFKHLDVGDANLLLKDFSGDWIPRSSRGMTKLGELPRATEISSRVSEVSSRGLTAGSNSSNKFLVTESIFSMSGEISPVKELAKISKQNDATFILDDAHGFGIIDSNYNQNDVHAIVIPLGKAVGSYGAIVAGSNELINAIYQFARTHRYTTGLPPHVCAASLKSLDIITKETWRREKLLSLVSRFKQGVKQVGLKLVADTVSPIQGILLDSPGRVVDVQRKLLEKGFLVSCIRPPTVAKNASRLRISLRCLLEDEDIDRLVSALGETILS